MNATTATTYVPTARDRALNRNAALATFRQDADCYTPGATLESATAYAFALADLVTLTEIRPYRGALNACLTDARYSSGCGLDWQPSDTACPACGEEADYCSGHGDMGDPEGAAVLAAHDDDDHSGCSRAADCDGSDVSYPDVDLQRAYRDDDLTDDDLDYACRVMVRYSGFLNSPAAGIVA